MNSSTFTEEMGNPDDYINEFLERWAFTSAGYVWCRRCDTWKDKSEFSPRKEYGHHSWCKTCMNAKHKAYAVANPEIRRVTTKASRDRVVEYGFTASQRDQLKRRFNLTPKEYFDRLNAQNNRCAITGLLLEDKFDLDHNDETKKNRDFILHKINLALGLFEHNSSWLRAAADYLDRHKE